MQQHLRRSTQAQPEPRRQTWTQRAKALSLAGLMALAGTPLWAQTNEPNQPPILGLTQPWEGANFNAPANVTLAAWAYDADGIQSIAFYDGATLLATDTQAPYEFQWANVPAGSHSITARATDTRGSVATSAAMTFTVNGNASNQAPTVSLTAPAAGASYTAPATVNITANAADSDGSIASVAFYNGATLLGSDTSAPYSFSWTDAPAGTHSLTARATDDDGATTTSAAVSVTVSAANQTPSVALTSPATGVQFTAPASITLTADATDSDGSISSVAFYNGATLLGTDTTAPYGFDWTNVAVGSYTLTARATDNSGATSISAAVAVTVNAPANIAPTVSLTTPATGAQFTAPAGITLTADAADSDGTVASVAFYNGATLLGTDTTAPYSFNWTNVAAGSYSLTAVATDNNGATSTSTAVAITVSAPANQAPTVSLTSPAAGASFTAPASITLTADAADSDGTVASVAFYNGATLLGTDTSAPYSFGWSNVPAGSYQIAAVATDNSGATTISVVVSVTVAQEEEPSETITYIHTDVSGSPLAATNANANVVWKENYAAYGERRLVQSTSEGQGQWFHGKEADATTGLQYFGARYYDPAVGRFMGVDPVGFQEGNLHSFNRYAYGNNNPVKYLDPDGGYADLAIEAVSLTVGFHSLIGNWRESNWSGAAVDAGGIVVDVVGAVIPGIPGVAGLGIKASREAAEVAAKGLAPAKTVVEEASMIKKADALTGRKAEAYEKIKDALSQGRAGGNQHELKGDLKGKSAVDLGGSGKGRGAERVIFSTNENEIIIHDIVDYHK